MTAKDARDRILVAVRVAARARGYVSVTPAFVEDVLQRPDLLAAADRWCKYGADGWSGTQIRRFVNEVNRDLGYEAHPIQAR
jgi:hypothetical protein